MLGSALSGDAVMVAIARICVAVLLICYGGAAVAAEADLYRAKVTVTGQGESNRLVGFAAGLEDVLIKVSGAQKLAGDRRLNAYKSDARSFVASFSYRDQFLGKPIRDEQGTRDRPYDLTVEFDRNKVDDLLAKLGLKPWLARRPRLAVFAAMEQGPRKYLVTMDEKQVDLQRDALLAAADRRGMSIALPDAAALARSNITAEHLAPAALASLAVEENAEVALIGRLVWDDRQLGWMTLWQMERDGRTHRWQLRGGTFDEAFRRGIGGAAQILSGNGKKVVEPGN